MNLPSILLSSLSSQPTGSFKNDHVSKIQEDACPRTEASELSVECLGVLVYIASLVSAISGDSGK